MLIYKTFVFLHVLKGNPQDSVRSEVLPIFIWKNKKTKKIDNRFHVQCFFRVREKKRCSHHLWWLLYDFIYRDQDIGMSQVQWSKSGLIVNETPLKLSLSAVLLKILEDELLISYLLDTCLVALQCRTFFDHFSLYGLFPKDSPKRGGWQSY